MRSKFDGLLWGLILIVAGGLFMARNMGYEVELTPVFWMGACAALSAVSFIRYFAGDHTRWGLLFPACQFAAIAIIIGLSQAGVTGAIIAAPLFIGFTVPFVVAFFVNRQQNTWAVIPAGIFSMLTVSTLIGEQAGDFFAALVVLTVAAPFFIVYITQPKQWWAIIPAGILGSIGVTALICAVSPTFDHSNVKNALFLLGFAATFSVVYLRRSVHPTEWAKYPAIVFGFLALLSLFEHTGIDAGPLVLIGLGVLLLFSTLRPRQHPIS